MGNFRRRQRKLKTELNYLMPKTQKGKVTTGGSTGGTGMPTVPDKFLKGLTRRKTISLVVQGKRVPMPFKTQITHPFIQPTAPMNIQELK